MSVTKGVEETDLEEYGLSPRWKANGEEMSVGLMEEKAVIGWLPMNRKRNTDTSNGRMIVLYIWG